MSLIAEVLRFVLPWMGVFRLQRDVAMKLATAGVESGNRRPSRWGAFALPNLISSPTVLFAASSSASACFVVRVVAVTSAFVLRSSAGTLVMSVCTASFCSAEADRLRFRAPLSASAGASSAFVS
jgi:hypothetical protein